MNSWWQLIFLFVLVGVSFCACETKDPGCLDTIATNYDVFAISECDSCCQYPSVKLNTLFRYDTLDEFRFNVLYELYPEDSISVNELQVVFSEFVFYSEGSPQYIIDTLQGKSPRVYDNVVLIEKASRNKEIGHTDYLKLIDSVSFTTGFTPSLLARLSPITNVDGRSNFSSIVDKMYVDSIPQLFQAKLKVAIRDSVRSLEIEDFTPTTIGFSLSKQLIAGENWDVPIYIDIRKLVDGISADQDNETMAAMIANNFPESILKR